MAEKKYYMIKRVEADMRSPDNVMNADVMANEELIRLQDAGAEIIDVKEVNKQTGIIVFLILYVQ